MTATVSTYTIPTRVEVNGRRFYRLPEDDALMPGVTTVLGAIGKPALVNWAANTERALVLEAAGNLWEDVPLGPTKMSRTAYIATLQDRLGKQKAHQKELAKAAEIGSQAHSLIEWNLRRELGQRVGPEPRIADKALWAFMVYEEWRKSVRFTPRLIEQMLWSRRYQYAGTMDVLGTLTLPEHGVCTVVLDWKSGKAIYPEALLQSAAYVQALIEMGHAEPPVHGLIVRLPKVDTDPDPDMKLIPWEHQGQLFEIFLAVKALWWWQYQQEAGRRPEVAEATTATSLEQALAASLAMVRARKAPTHA